MPFIYNNSKKLFFTSSRWPPSLKPFCWCWCIFVDHFYREKRANLLGAIIHPGTELYQRCQLMPCGIVPAHFDFISTSQPSLPVAGVRASRHHAPTADARLTVTVWLQHQTEKTTLKDSKSSKQNAMIIVSSLNLLV